MCIVDENKPEKPDTHFKIAENLKPRLHDATFVEQHWWIFVETSRATKIEPCGRPFNIVDHCSPML